MTRPVGKQIRAMLEVSESLKRPAPALELARAAGLTLDSTNCTRICRRAESYGLMDIAAERPLRFIARPGWDAQTAPKATAIKPVIDQAPRRIINSVFALGAV